MRACAHAGTSGEGRGGEGKEEEKEEYEGGKRKKKHTSGIRETLQTLGRTSARETHGPRWKMSTFVFVPAITEAAGVTDASRPRKISH